MSIQVGFRDYMRRKAAGKVQLTPTSSGKFFGLLLHRYDPSTGEELEPETGVLARVAVEQQRQQLLEDLESINQILADMDSLKKPDSGEVGAERGKAKAG